MSEGKREFLSGPAPSRPPLRWRKVKESGSEVKGAMAWVS
jgi:hypothetical protein